MRGAVKVPMLAVAGCLALIGVLASVPARAQQHWGGGARAYSRGYVGHARPVHYSGGYTGGYSYVNFAPGYSQSVATAPYAYMPKYWWVGSYPTADPRQVGYNPHGGYAWNQVTTLMLSTYPTDSRVTLDGIMVGEADELGPIELPLGEHTLRVEAPGYAPSETVIKVETPTLQQLAVNLKTVDTKSASRQ